MNGSTSAARMLFAGVAAFLGLGFTGCDKPHAIGDATQILVGADQPVWDSLEPQIKAVLEPTTFTVRDERVFDIAHVDPADERWGNLRVTRQILLIGDRNHPAVAAAVEAHRGSVPQPPSIFQARNVWAQNQLVTVALLPDGSDAAAVEPLLPRVGQSYLDQFEEYARARMFVTGPNQALRDSLRRSAGFSLTLPQVYRQRPAEAGVLIFRNDQPDPSRLIRNVTVASRPRGTAALTAETAAAWRADLAARFTEPPQLSEAVSEFQVLQLSGRPALQIQGIWSNPPGHWPAAGPHITRLVDCPDRLFLLDAWLYAPGIPKYEYVYQLKTILDSFECGSMG